MLVKVWHYKILIEYIRSEAMQVQVLSSVYTDTCTGIHKPGIINDYLCTQTHVHISIYLKD